MPEASEAYAGIVLGMIGTLVSIRTGEKVAPPTRDEIRRAGKVMAEVQWRRAGWSTGFDDLAGLAGCIGGYAYSRAAMPAPRKAAPTVAAVPTPAVWSKPVERKPDPIPVEDAAPMRLDAE